MSVKKHKLPPIQHTVPEVFILESLSFADEEAGRFEGRIIRDLLLLAGKKPLYYYFRTEQELEEFAGKFRTSKYRYLHLSCHGSPMAINTTLGEISITRFADIFEGHLKLRRLFVSACEIGSGFLAEHVIAKNKGMHSIASPIDKILFSRAVAIWGAFYIRMFDLNPSSMSSKDTGILLKNLCQLFGERFKWTWYNAKMDIWNPEEIDGTKAEAVVKFGTKFKTPQTAADIST